MGHGKKSGERLPGWWPPQAQTGLVRGELGLVGPLASVICRKIVLYLAKEMSQGREADQRVEVVGRAPSYQRTERSRDRRVRPKRRRVFFGSMGDVNDGISHSAGPVIRRRVADNNFKQETGLDYGPPTDVSRGPRSAISSSAESSFCFQPQTLDPARKIVESFGLLLIGAGNSQC